MKPYIYIIFAVIWFVYNAYKNMQKKQTENPETVPSGEPNKEMDFKTILEEMLTGKQRTPPKAISPEKTNSENAIEEYDISKDKKLNISKVSNEKITKNKIKNTITLPPPEEDKPFDLRQALIYSEILKRPEY